MLRSGRTTMCEEPGAEEEEREEAPGRAETKPPAVPVVPVRGASVVAVVCDAKEVCAPGSTLPAGPITPEELMVRKPPVVCVLVCVCAAAEEEEEEAAEGGRIKKAEVRVLPVLVEPETELLIGFAWVLWLWCEDVCTAG